MLSDHVSDDIEGGVNDVELIRRRGESQASGQRSVEVPKEGWWEWQKTKKRQKDKKAKRRLMKEAKRCNLFDGINF